MYFHLYSTLKMISDSEIFNSFESKEFLLSHTYDTAYI